MSDQLDRRGALLRAYLEEFDDDCPLCGYSLRGLQGTDCPECGEPLRLRVGVQSGVPRWYVAGLVGISVALGVYVPISLVVLASGSEFILAVLPGIMIAIVALIGWVAGRRRLARASSLTRSCFMSGAIVSPIVLPILTFILVAFLGL